MALQIWLPLTNANRTQNHGLLGDLTITATPSIIAGGKLGGTLNGGGYKMSADQTKMCLNNKEFSCAFWVKVTSSAESKMFFGNDDPRQFSIFNYPTINDLHLSWANSAGTNVLSFVDSGVFPTNVWTHCCVTYNNPTVTVYINGNVLRTYSYTCDLTDFAKETQVVHSATGRYLNDFRVYNHCLSPKEVKEISKGLVLHYKMDDKIATNLVKNHQYNIYNNHNVPASLTKLSETFQGCDVYRLSMTPTSSYIGGFQTELRSHGIYGFSNVTFKANTKYCFWIYYRPVSHSDVRVGGNASNIPGWYEIPPTEYGSGWKVVGQYRNGSVTSDKTDYIFTSFYCPSAVAGTPITIDFCCPHLIEGCSEIIDDGDYQEVNPHTTIYDCSGFGYNGSKINSLFTSSDTARYTSSFDFGSDTSNHYKNCGAIKCPIDLSGCNSCTIAFWAKPIGNHSLFCLSGDSSGGGYEDKYLQHFDGNIFLGYQSGKKISFNPTLNEWHN